MYAPKKDGTLTPIFGGKRTDKPGEPQIDKADSTISENNREEHNTVQQWMGSGQNSNLLLTNMKGILEEGNTVPGKTSGDVSHLTERLFSTGMQRVVYPL